MSFCRASMEPVDSMARILLLAGGMNEEECRAQDTVNL